jgi:hypothetical protein
MFSDNVKILRSNQLKTIALLPAYEEYEGIRLSDYLASQSNLNNMRRSEDIDYSLPLFFISHRWENNHHPDPEGNQLAKLKELENCFIIYDYSSFPQDTNDKEHKKELLEVLSNMNSMIKNVSV